MSLHLAADMQANYSRFVNRVRSSGTVWAEESQWLGDLSVA